MVECVGGAFRYRLGWRKEDLSAASKSKRMIFNSTTNQKQAATTEGTTEGRRDEREAWGKQVTIILMAL